MGGSNYSMYVISQQSYNPSLALPPYLSRHELNIFIGSYFIRIYCIYFKLCPLGTSISS